MFECRFSLNAGLMNRIFFIPLPPSFYVVPALRIERRTFRLQGGCSTTELSRPKGTSYKLCAYLMRRNVGLPPPGFFGGSGDGAGSAGGRVLEAGSLSALACTAALGPSMSKGMPWPVSLA